MSPCLRSFTGSQECTGSSGKTFVGSEETFWSKRCGAVSLAAADDTAYLGSGSSLAVPLPRQFPINGPGIVTEDSLSSWLLPPMWETWMDLPSWLCHGPTLAGCNYLGSEPLNVGSFCLSLSFCNHA